MRNSLRQGLVVFELGAVICATWISARGQQPGTPLLPAPPPMRLVSRVEHSELSAALNPKSRLHATIALAEDHLSRAETLTNEKKFEAASCELGSYLGLIDDLRDFLEKLDSDKGSTRDLYRHMEISVRAHISRLAVLRRNTPADYAVHIKDAEEYIKDTRSAALDSFYGHSVLREPNAGKPPAAAAPIQSSVIKRP